MGTLQELALKGSLTPLHNVEQLLSPTPSVAQIELLPADLVLKGTTLCSLPVGWRLPGLSCEVLKYSTQKTDSTYLFLFLMYRT